jgi:hypothetical protein
MRHDQHPVINSHFHTIESAIEHITFFVSFLFGVMLMNSTLFLVIYKDCLLEPLWDEKSATNVIRMKT